MGHPEDDYRPEREALRAHVVGLMNGGATQPQLLDDLGAYGFDRTEAARYLAELEAEGDRQRLSTGELALAVAAGIAAAIGCGVAWAWLAESGGPRSSVLLLAIGLVTGWAVSGAALGARGRALQAIALGAAVAGVLVGRYVLFADVLAEHIGATGPTSTLNSAMSAGTLSAYLDAFGALFGIWDVVFGGLAAAIAWWSPRGIRLRRRSPDGPFG